MFASPAKVANRSSTSPVREPNNWPAGQESEKKEIYVTYLKSDCPVEQIDISGKVSFCKGLVNPDWSLRKNQGKHFPLQYRTIELSEKEAEYVKGRLDREIVIPRRKGFGRTINAKDFCVFCKIDEFKASEIGDISTPEPAPETDIESQELAEAQADRNKNKGSKK